MEKNEIKKAYELAEKELEEKKIEEIKKIVKTTLEKLENLKKDKDKIDKEIKILKMDLDDLKEGRLDRISERQEKDKEAEKISVVKIIREVIVERISPWYIPYRIIWNPPYIPFVPDTPLDPIFTVGSNDNWSITINSSLAKTYSSGTYDIGGTIIHFR